MKLRNKKTGEIKEVIVGGYPVTGETKMWKCSEMDANEETGYKSLGTYTSLAKLNEVWEDYEEPKEYWCIDWTEPDGIYRTVYKDEWDDFNKEIGNYFETKEEAEKAVEKLKAVKRLKDKGFVLSGEVCDEFFCIDMYMRFDEETKSMRKDLDLLFGGEK